MEIVVRWNRLESTYNRRVGEKKFRTDLIRSPARNIGMIHSSKHIPRLVFPESHPEYVMVCQTNSQFSIFLGENLSGESPVSETPKDVKCSVQHSIYGNS